MMSHKATIIDTGIRYHQEFSKYLAEDALNSSRIKAFRKAERLAAPGIWGVKQEEKDIGRDLVIGSATHALTWQPGEFEKVYVKMPAFNLRKPEEKNERDWYYKTYGEERCLSVAEYDLAIGLRDALWNDEDCRFYLENVADTEVSIYWEDREFGVKKKIRPDGVTPDRQVMFDLKTCADASPRGFRRTFFERGYDIQAGLYLEGAEAVGWPTSEFVFLAVEKEPPYLVGVYQVSPDRLWKAREEIRDLTRRFSECLESGNWAGYGHHVL